MDKMIGGDFETGLANMKAARKITDLNHVCQLPCAKKQLAFLAENWTNV
jgi:hypothetical protein